MGAEQTIGGYRLLHKLGEGGMGVVWEAEQDNPRRRVALKISRGGPLADKELVRLFRREVQALARLRHASIAAIYDAGSTPDGQHWFAMELVRGLTLNEYLQKHSPDLEERLALFLQICQAVSYAHQRAVLHRDLKPSNLVVLPPTEADSGGSLPTPRVKVLDFGLARVTEADIAITTVVTEAGQIRGTLPYMSPEQVLGNPDAIDVRSDIYSLGVVLCEMVTGQLPYEIPGSLHQAIRVIVEEPPRLAGESRLDPDLETIIFKALEKEPERRYAGAAGLGADVERFLTHQPILARPPSTVYQLRKLMVRHKTAVGFSTALLVLLVGFAVVMTIQSVRIAQQRDRALVAEEQATNEARTSQQVTELMVGLFEAADPGKTRGDTITAREVLDQGAEDLEASLEEEPAVQSRLQQVIGRVYGALGLLTPAEENLEAALERQRQVYGDQSLEAAATLYEFSQIKFARFQFAEARGPAREALEIRRELLDEDSLVLAESLIQVGTIRAVAFNRDEEREQIEEMLRQALEIRRSRLGSDHLLVAEALRQLGHFYGRSLRLTEAEPLLKESLALSRKLLEPDDPRMILALGSFGLHYALFALDPDRAEPFIREQLQLQEKIYGKGHPDYRETLSAYARVALVRKGKFEEADRLHREAWEAGNPVELSPDRLSFRDGQFLGLWAWCLWSQGKYQEAETRFRQAVGPNPAFWPFFAQFLVERGKLAQAQEILEEVIERQRGEHSTRDLYLSRLGKVLQAQGKPNQAREAFVESEKLLRQHVKRHQKTRRSLQVAQVRGALGDCLKGLGRYEEAEPWLLELHARHKENRGERHALTRIALRDVVALYEDWGKPEETARYRALLHEITPNP